MSNFTPFNRHILVDILEEDEQEQEHSFLLPEDYRKQKSPYVLCKVRDFSCDCKIDIATNMHIVVQRSMIEQIEIVDKTYYLVLENYVYGSIKNEVE
jgi:hypothetical protein